MNGLVINISWEYFFGILGSIILMAWYSGNRFSGMETSIKWIKESITKLEGRMDNAFGQGSPIRLFPKGIEILEASGLKDYITKNKDVLLSKCGLKKGSSNQYDIQEQSFECFDKNDFGEMEAKLKETAYKFGVSLDTVKRVGGIHFRDLVLADHGFTLEDLDKPQTQ